MADNQQRKGGAATVAVVNNADDASFAGAAVQVCVCLHSHAWTFVLRMAPQGYI